MTKCERINVMNGIAAGYIRAHRGQTLSQCIAQFLKNTRRQRMCSGMRKYSVNGVNGCSYFHNLLTAKRIARMWRVVYGYHIEKICVKDCATGIVIYQC